jgi:oligo-1,6-glucosidase
MSWWLDKGIDGFRLDVINMISKVPGLPDAPVVSDERYQWGGQYFIQGPRLVEYLREMREKVLSKYDVFTVGETPGVTTEHAVDITHEEAGSLNMLFQFEHMDLAPRNVLAKMGKWHVGPWDLLELKQVMTRWQKDWKERVGIASTSPIMTSRGRSPALETTDNTASSQPRCWRHSSTCCTVRRTSTKGRKSA